MGRFIIKHIYNTKPQLKNTSRPVVSKVEENKVEENKEVMTTSEKIQAAQNVLDNANSNASQFKRVKKDKGLIERTESSKTILTEDNKELLND